jgi:nitrite reductase/ring-hydroxylating ferredoxin subunit
MTGTVAVGKASLLPPGYETEVVVDGGEILLANVDGSYYAVANGCPNRGGKLSHGMLRGNTLVCPWHGSQFDVRDGRVIRWARGLPAILARIVARPTTLATYELEVEGDTLLLKL